MRALAAAFGLLAGVVLLSVGYSGYLLHSKDDQLAAVLLSAGVVLGGIGLFAWLDAYLRERS
jgi:hypothetical protein